MTMRTLGTKRSPRSEQGFVLPIVLGIGLIMSLLGVVLINRSIQNRTTTTAQKATSQSSAAAEAGIAQFQSLLVRYPALATYCSKTLSEAPCNNLKNWQNITETDLIPCPPLNTKASDLIKSYADDFDKNEWQLLGTNPDEGQFRLVSYIYSREDPTKSLSQAPGTGELVIEGKMGSESLNTSITRLSAKFAVKSAIPPGLWIQSNEASILGDSTQIKTHVRDSTCPNTTTYNRQVTEIKNHQIPANTYHYQSTPGEAFPSFSKPGFNHYKLNPLNLNNKAQKLPRLDDVVRNGQIVYKVEDDYRKGWSLNLSNNATLEIGTGNETVILKLDGTMSIREQSKIKLARGSKLIIYTHHSVSMIGGPADPIIEQSMEPTAEPPISTNVQFYISPPDEADEPRSNVTITGGAGMSLFLFAPESQVTLKSAAKVRGIIWSMSFQGFDSSELAEIPTNLETPTNLTDLKFTFPPRISPLTAWERVP